MLCQSDPVLNDGEIGSDSSKTSGFNSVQRRFLEKLVAEHENKDDDGSSSD